MQSYVITIFGSKGGVGKTVLASNFAYSLHKKSKGKVILIDSDPHDCGDVSLLLGSSVKNTMAEIAPSIHKLTPQSLEALISKTEEGVGILPVAQNPRGFQNVPPDQVEKIFELLRKVYTYIVVDAGSDFHPVNIKPFEVSSLVLFCTTPDIMSLNRSVHSLNEFRSVGFPSDLIEVVVNHFDPTGVITAAMIQQKLKMKCFGLLPTESEEMENSIHDGLPLVISKPKTPYAQVIDEMVRTMLSDGLLKPVQTRKISGSTPHGATTISRAGQERIYGKRVEEEMDRLADVRLQIHQKLIEMMDFRKLSPEELTKQDDRSIQELRTKTHDVIMNIIDKIPEISTREERQKIAKEVLDEALALGPLEDLLKDESVSEILVNRKDQVYVERNGKLTLTNCRFTSDKHLLGVIERIVAPIGRRIDEKTPMVDARLRDGSRVHAIIPPLALDGPMLTIRKFKKGVFSMDEMAKLGALTPEIADFLKACVQSRLNILVSGGTGTGKTTLLNVLAGFIPSNERIVTVEDAAELKLQQEHVGRLESRPANLQGEGAITIRELVRNTLRMRPDRIIVGECRGAEALDMLQAMNTGHDGSMTTIHANSPRDSVARMETLVMFSGLELPSRAIREQIASAIQVVVQLTRLSDGSRKVTAVTEVTGIEGSTVQLQDLFVYKQKGIDPKGKVLGAFTATGLVPTFLDLLKQKGIALPKGIFGGKE